MSEAQIRQIIRDELKNLIAPDRYTFQKHIQLFDARHIQLGKTNGSMIGTAANQKLAFFGATPVTQRNGIAQPSGPGTAGVDSAARTAINSLIAALHDLGITA